MSIRGKLVTLTLLCSLFVGALPVLMSFDETNRSISRGYEERGVVIAEKLAYLLSDLKSKLGTMDDTATVIAALRHRDVIAAYALDRGGLVVNDGTKQNLQKNGTLPAFDAVRKEVVAKRDVVTSVKEGRMHISGPVIVNDKIEGFVHVVVSMGRASDSFRRVAGIQGLTLAAALLLVMGTSFLYHHRFNARIRQLVHGMEEIKAGRYALELLQPNNDGISRLAGHINEVSAAMRATTISKRYLDEVLQSMVDSLIVVDTDANIVTVNRATVEMLGYPEKKLIGQPASLICIDEGYQLTGARLDHLLGQQTQQDYELMYKTSQGNLIPISFSGSPIRDTSGDVVGYVCIGKDIAERKRAQEERDRLNQKLVETSRQAGMAEVATGVLHNVGNVLNSVNMSATVVVDQIKRSKVAGLSKAVDLLKNHEQDLGSFLTSDDKGKQLPVYLSQLTEHLADEQASIIGELNSLTKNINHIKEIINMQQSYSKVTDMKSSVDLSELVDEALRLNANSLERHDVKVERSVAYVPSIATDKHKVLQVLVNLITNAKDAMMDGPEGQRTLSVKVRQESADGMVRIEVSDTGCGIPEENLTRVFTHGFTTKENGHGFGLHSAALTATELGGSLVADSEGIGHGATFILSLPLQIAEVKK